MIKHNQKVVLYDVHRMRIVSGKIFLYDGDYYLLCNSKYHNGAYCRGYYNGIRGIYDRVLKNLFAYSYYLCSRFELEHCLDLKHCAGFIAISVA